MLDTAEHACHSEATVGKSVNMVPSHHRDSCGPSCPTKCCCGSAFEDSETKDTDFKGSDIVPRVLAIKEDTHEHSHPPNCERGNKKLLMVWWSVSSYGPHDHSAN